MRKPAILAAVLGFGLVLASCSSAAESSTNTSAGGQTSSAEGDAPAAGGGLRIKFVINGGLGDKSFFDSANAGLQRVTADLGYQVQVVELGSDRTKWEPGFEDAAAGDDYDIFVAGTFDVIDYIGNLAPQYPDKKFWVFDAPVNYGGDGDICSNKCENVYSVTFKQNEGGYLAGYLAQKLVDAKALPGAEDLTKVGVMGAVEIPLIKDFVTGFQAGFKDAGGAESDVLVQYVGGDKPFGDPAKGKEIATSMYGQGAAIVWSVAGLSGLGAFESAVTTKRYTFGIDSDQYQTLADEAQKQTVITSILKNVGNALYKAAEQDKAGTLAYGSVETVGLAEDAVGYVADAQFEKIVPQEIRDELTAASDKVKDGSVVVPSAF